MNYPNTKDVWGLRFHNKKVNKMTIQEVYNKYKYLDNVKSKKVKKQSFSDIALILWDSIRTHVEKENEKQKNIEMALSVLNDAMGKISKNTFLKIDEIKKS